jgi:hypothetical protein
MYSFYVFVLLSIFVVFIVVILRPQKYKTGGVNHNCMQNIRPLPPSPMPRFHSYRPEIKLSDIPPDGHSVLGNNKDNFDIIIDLAGGTVRISQKIK